MAETAIKLLREFGLPTLIAIGLGVLLWRELAAAREERGQVFEVTMDYVMEVRETVQRLEKRQCPP